MELIISILFSLGNFCLGLFTFLKKKQSWTHRLFLLLSTTLAVWVIVNYFSLNSPSEESTLFWIRFVMALAVVQTITFLLFVITFPHSKILLSKWIILILLILGIITIVFSMSPYLFTDVSIEKGKISPIAGPAMALFIPVATGSLLGGFIILIKKYRHSLGIKKLQIKYLLLGILLMFLLIIISNFILVVLFKISTFVIFSPLYTIFFVAFITYAIVKYRLMDIRFFIRRGVVHIISLIIMLAVYTYLVLLIQDYLKVNNLVAVLLSVLLIALTIYPFRKWLFQAIDQLFYKQEIEKEKRIKGLLSKLPAVKEYDQIQKEIYDVVSQRIKTSDIRILFLDKEKGEYLKVYPQEAKAINLDWHDLLIDYLQNESPFLIREEIPYKINLTGGAKARDLEELERKMSSWKTEAIIALKEEKVLGIVLIGPKDSKEAFTVQDTNFMHRVSEDGGCGLANVLLYKETIEGLRRRIEAGEIG